MNGPRKGIPCVVTVRYVRIEKLPLGSIQPFIPSVKSPRGRKGGLSLVAATLVLKTSHPHLLYYCNFNLAAPYDTHREWVPELDCRREISVRVGD